MTSLSLHDVLTFGLFEKRIDGDDCLLELARRRFQEAGMGAEMHAGAPDQLERLLRFRPGECAPVVLHLPRDFHLLDESSRHRIGEFATCFAGRICGMVVHDHSAMVARWDDSLDAVRTIHRRLAAIQGSPTLYVEYAVGIEPENFARFFASIRDLERVSACLDIGHVAMRQAHAHYRARHPGHDLSSLKRRATLTPAEMVDVEAAVRGGAAAVLDLVESLSRLGKPIHYHLHDGHPLSTVSPFGVSDHLSFLAQVPLSFEHDGRRAVDPLFGPTGLTQVVTRALEALQPCRPSFTLEIHPTGEQRPLADAASLFGHWHDLTHAEKMNHWVEVLIQNHRLVQNAIREARAQEVPKPAVHPCQT